MCVTFQGLLTKAQGNSPQKTEKYPNLTPQGPKTTKTLALYITHEQNIYRNVRLHKLDLYVRFQVNSYYTVKKSPQNLKKAPFLFCASYVCYEFFCDLPKDSR